MVSSEVISGNQRTPNATRPFARARAPAASSARRDASVTSSSRPLYKASTASFASSCSDCSSSAVASAAAAPLAAASAAATCSTRAALNQKTQSETQSEEALDDTHPLHQGGA